MLTAQHMIKGEFSMKIDVMAELNVIVATPDDRLTKAEIEIAREALDGYINEHDQAPSMVIVAEKAPLWEDFDALKHHLALVSSRQELIARAAIVSDSTLIWAARGVADIFTKAKIRRFTAGAKEEAIMWASEEDDHAGGISIIDGLPRDTLGVRFSGTITSRDYTETLTPLVNEASVGHDKLKLLCVVDEGFEGYSAGAVWDDMRLGFSNLTTFSKIALVTDVSWLRKGAKFFGTMVPTELVTFDLDEINEATAWIKT